MMQMTSTRAGLTLGLASSESCMTPSGARPRKARRLTSLLTMKERTSLGLEHGIYAISYLESSFLSAHTGFMERATLERSVRGAALIGCSKTMRMTGSIQRLNMADKNARKACCIFFLIKRNIFSSDLLVKRNSHLVVLHP